LAALTRHRANRTRTLWRVVPAIVPAKYLLSLPHVNSPTDADPADGAVFVSDHVGGHVGVRSVEDEKPILLATHQAERRGQRRIGGRERLDDRDLADQPTAEHSEFAVGERARAQGRSDIPA
jgi:hypothetical protein